MPDKKLTDNEIVKALENAEYKCDGIELRGFYLDHESMKQVIDLINRLQAENERLQGAIKSSKEIKQRLRAEINVKKKLLDIAEERFKNIKAEAYKECIEKVEKEITEALKSNYKARSERIAKVEVGSADEFIAYCEGKIHCLRGLDDFLDNLLKELGAE